VVNLERIVSLFEANLVHRNGGWGAYDRYQVVASLDQNFNYQGFITAPLPTSQFDSAYYFDVPDYVRRFRLTNLDLYGIYPSGRGDLVDGYTTYGTEYPLALNAAADRRFYGSESRLDLTFTTIGLQRINTLPIFDNAGDAFTQGRYPEMQKMAVILLDLNTKPDESFSDADLAEINASPFELGMNAIVVPSELFLNTKLHSLIENAVNEFGMVNWELMPACLRSETIQVSSGAGQARLEHTVEITGLDRSNPEGTASEWLEVLLTKKYCALAEAYDILNLTLVSILNETSG